MCEIFGTNFPSKETVNSYLDTFFSHSDKHPHGWGLATGEEDHLLIEKEPVQATKSTYLHYRLTSDIHAKTTLAHIRYATMGHVEYENCHPFQKKDNTGRIWTLIHNGTIFEYPEMEPYIQIQKGQTDSERILLYFLENINEVGKELSVQERCELLDKLVIKLSVGNKINFMLFDEEILYVHCNYYGSLHYLNKNDGYIFSTQPLSNEPWRRFPFTQMMAFKDGRVLYEGTPHGHEYVEIPEHTKFLYTIFSDL